MSITSQQYTDMSSIGKIAIHLSNPQVLDLLRNKQPQEIKQYLESVIQTQEITLPQPFGMNPALQTAMMPMGIAGLNVQQPPTVTAKKSRSKNESHVWASLEEYKNKYITMGVCAYMPSRGENIKDKVCCNPAVNTATEGSQLKYRCKFCTSKMGKIDKMLGINTKTSGVAVAGYNVPNSMNTFGQSSAVPVTIPANVYQQKGLSSLPPMIGQTHFGVLPPSLSLPPRNDLSFPPSLPSTTLQNVSPLPLPPLPSLGAYIPTVKSSFPEPSVSTPPNTEEKKMSLPLLPVPSAIRSVSLPLEGIPQSLSELPNNNPPAVIHVEDNKLSPSPSNHGDLNVIQNVNSKTSHPIEEKFRNLLLVDEDDIVCLGRLDLGGQLIEHETVIPSNYRTSSILKPITEEDQAYLTQNSIRYEYRVETPQAN